MAAEFVRMQTEMTELQQYKAQLADQIKENQEMVEMKGPSLEEVKSLERVKPGLAHRTGELADEAKFHM